MSTQVKPDLDAILKTIVAQFKSSGFGGLARISLAQSLEPLVAYARSLEARLAEANTKCEKIHVNNLSYLAAGEKAGFTFSISKNGVTMKFDPNTVATVALILRDDALARLEAAERDTQRLNWLESKQIINICTVRASECTGNVREMLVNVIDGCYEEKTIRKAIDAAILSDTKERNAK